ncbi:MAG: ankyrin repeat domain-containing protein [Arenicella sp.]
MGKKRKTLPKDFEELLASGDISALKKVFDKCELDAYRYSKRSAITFDLCPDELVEWLVEQGADLHKEDEYGDSPVHQRAGSHRSSIKVLLDLGADVTSNTKRSGTPLHAAARSRNVPNAKLLLQYGSDINEKDSSGMTPLEKALVYCSNIDIVQMVEFAKLFFEHGANETPRMKELVTKIGENFEFSRDGFNKDSVDEFSDALRELYLLFKVPPVPSRLLHDGQSEIIVKAVQWQDQYEELWNTLVPAKGPAQTEQGEVVRISGKISDELYRNAGANWGNDHRKMGKSYLTLISSGKPLSNSEINEVRSIIANLGSLEEGVHMLQKYAVKWVSKNTRPTTLTKPDYNI